MIMKELPLKGLKLLWSKYPQSVGNIYEAFHFIFHIGSKNKFPSFWIYAELKMAKHA